MSPAADSERPIRSVAEFCERFFPKAHAAGTCDCQPKREQGILVIQPRQGRQLRVLR